MNLVQFTRGWDGPWTGATLPDSTWKQKNERRAVAVEGEGTTATGRELGVVVSGNRLILAFFDHQRSVLITVLVRVFTNTVFVLTISHILSFTFNFFVLKFSP